MQTTLTLPLPRLLCTAGLRSVAPRAVCSRSLCCRQKQLEKPLGGKKKAAWGHLSLNSPDCENSGHLFTSLQGAGLKCLFADRVLKACFPRKASAGWQAGVCVLLHDFLGAALFPAEEEEEVSGVQLELTLV